MAYIFVFVFYFLFSIYIKVLYIIIMCELHTYNKLATHILCSFDYLYFTYLL